MWNIIFLITGVIFLVLLIIIFFSKESINSTENRLFKVLIIINAIEYLNEIPLQIFVRTLGINAQIVDIYCKLYLISILLFFNIFSIYTFVISSNKKQAKNEKKYVITRIIHYVFFILASIFIVVLPFEKYYEGDKMFLYGTSIDLFKLLLGLYMVIWSFLLIKNYKLLKNKKYVPIYLTILFGIANVFIQVYDPSVLITTVTATIICYTMAFTIENPDVKMLEEFKIAKDRAEKANKEKELFLYNITQDIRIPLSNIKKSSTWINTNLDEIKKNDIKEGMYYINNNASIVLDKVNNVLDITNMEITNIKVYNTKYNIKLLLDELHKIYSKKIDKNIKLRFNIDSNIPELLNGDSLRLKQLLTIILDNSVKYTEKGFIELNLNTIVKKDVCRLVISIEDSGCGIKASEIDDIFNKNNQNYNNLDKIDDSKKNLAIAKSITTLLGGILMLESEIGSRTKVTLVLDQKIYDEKSNELKKIETEVASYINKKKVMVVSEDSEYLDSLIKKLSKYDIEVIPFDLGSKCLEYIRLNKSCDLIIIDELLNHLSALDILNKLKSIKTFNIKVAILTENIENKSYINDGFNYILNRKVDKKELDNLINGIEKYN